MGVGIKSLLVSEEIQLQALSGKVVAVDAYNMLYQFLTSVRSYDGGMLQDEQGRVTSHLQGAFSRTITMLKAGMTPIFVFDGKAPDLKKAVTDERKSRKLEAKKKYEQALSEQDTEKMHSYAMQTATLTKEMATQAKELMEALGCVCIDAPAEGEAQAAHMCLQGDADAVITQDVDALLFGAPSILRNVSNQGRRKLPSKPVWVQVKPEQIFLQRVLEQHKVTRKQLIAIGMLVGTDYAPGGVKGLGPKKATSVVQQHGEDFSTLFSEVGWNDHHEVGWETVFDAFISPSVIDNYSLEKPTLSIEKVRSLMVETYNFSAERIDKTLTQLEEVRKAKQQKNLDSFFG